MYVRPGGIAFARFAHASSFDWFAQPVGFPSTPNPKKGDEQAPPQPAQCLNTFLVFSLDQAIPT